MFIIFLLKTFYNTNMLYTICFSLSLFLWMPSVGISSIYFVVFSGSIFKNVYAFVRSIAWIASIRANWSIKVAVPNSF